MIRRQPPPKKAVRAPGNDQRWRVAGICLVLAAITFAVFGQTLHHDFVNFDDDVYVYENPVVARGLTFKGIIWAFTGVHAGNWHPLTWLSHMLDCQLYGLNPSGHHLTNVLLHTLTVIALFLVLRQMTGALWRSAFVAAVFAIHPLRVESVAWVAERKDVLSGLFFMLTIGTYVRYARGRHSVARYGLVMLLFAMGLMCKPMLVTLPIVLLLLDYWPLQRKESTGKLVMEKLPLLALSAAACVATLLAQTETIQTTESFTMPLRFENAVETFMVYIGQMVYPSGLAVFYPYPHNGFPLWEVGLAVALLVGLSAFALWQRRTQPWLLIGWLWYLVMLLPVIGIIQVGKQAHADRYTYLPLIGLCIAATWLVADWGEKRQSYNVAFGGLMSGVIIVLMVCAWKQTTYWRNNETLWTHTLACTVNNDVAHYDFGNSLLQNGKTEEAIAHFQEALKIKPDYVDASANIGNAFLQEGKVDDAIAQYEEALKIQPDFADAHVNLGNALLQEGRVDDAITHFQAALKIEPNEAKFHNNLGNALMQKGSTVEAIAHFQEALKIDPDEPEMHYNLGNALLKAGSVDDAITQYQEALKIKPDYVDVLVNLGNALLKKGSVDDAIIHFQQALQIKPDNAKAQNNLGNAFLQKGKIEEAIAHFQEALQIEPSQPGTQNTLAWLLATCPEVSLRNGDHAVELARQANQLTGGENPIILHTLAAAFAETGRFSEAVETAQHALRLAGAQSKIKLAAQLQLELKLYQAGSPYHATESTR